MHDNCMSYFTMLLVAVTLQISILKSIVRFFSNIVHSAIYIGIIFGITIMLTIAILTYQSFMLHCF